MTKAKDPNKKPKTLGEEITISRQAIDAEFLAVLREDLAHVAANAPRHYNTYYTEKLYNARGGAGAASHLMSKPVQTGFIACVAFNMIERSVEARMLEPRFSLLFPSHELFEAVRRL